MVDLTCNRPAATPIKMNIKNCLCSKSSNGYLQPPMNASCVVQLKSSSRFLQHEAGRAAVWLIQSSGPLMPQHSCYEFNSIHIFSNNFQSFWKWKWLRFFFEELTSDWRKSHADRYDSVVLLPASVSLNFIGTYWLSLCLFSPAAIIVPISKKMQINKKTENCERNGFSSWKRSKLVVSERMLTISSCVAFSVIAP